MIAGHCGEGAARVQLGGLEGEFDGGEVVAVASLDHFVRVGPVESGQTVGRLGDGVGSEPGDFAGSFSGGQGLVELGCGGRSASEPFGKAGPFL